MVIRYNDILELVTVLSDEKGLQVNWRSGQRSMRQNTCLIVFFILDSFYGIRVCTEFQTMCKILLKNQKLVKGGGGGYQFLSRVMEKGRDKGDRPLIDIWWYNPLFSRPFHVI